MTHWDLFSGIGGCALAANRCGYDTIAFCEHDEFCKRVLRKHWPTVRIFGDIHDLDGTQFRGVRLLTGGFPCQPYSNAGLKRGADDHRAIWPQMLRIITEARPSYVLGENVAGIVNMELDDVLSALESQGYATQAFIIPACAVDAKHRRDRVWILGADTMANPASGELDGGTNKPGGGTQGGIAFDGSGDALADPDESMRQRQHPSQGSGQSGEQSQGRDDIAGDGEALADPNCGGRTSSKHTRGGTTKDCGGKENTVTGDCALADPNDPRRTQQRPAKPARTQLKTPQRPSEWAIEPNICRMAHGIPNRVHRLRGLGNSIVSQVAEEIIRAIPE